MEYDGMTEEVVASGMNAGINGSTIISGSGSGCGGATGFGVGFFFLGFGLHKAAAPPPAQQRQHKAVKSSHCQVRR